MDPRIGPAGFPVIQIFLAFFQTFKAKTFQWCFLRVTDTGFHLSFAVGIPDFAWHGRGAVMRQHVSVQWIESGIVEVRTQNTFAKIVQNDDAWDATQAAE